MFLVLMSPLVGGMLDTSSALEVTRKECSVIIITHARYIT